MSTELRPGTLAIIVKSTFGNNFGKIVTIERWIPKNERFMVEGHIFFSGESGLWMISSPHKNLHFYNITGTIEGYTDRTAYAAHALRPRLRPAG